MDNLMRLLNDSEIYHDHSKVNYLVKLIIEYMNNGYGLEKLFPHMLKLLMQSDIRVKRCVYKYIVNYSHRVKDGVFLAINTLCQDACCGNPVLRGLALRTLSSLQFQLISQHISDPLCKGLNDQSAYVRRSAVLSLIPVFHLTKNTNYTENYIDDLYSMIRDSDSLVKINSLLTLDELLKDEGGVVINKPITYFLLNDISNFHESHIPVILHFLSRYQPLDRAEIIRILNTLDSFLDSHDFSVISSLLSYILKITKHLPHLQMDLAQRIQKVVMVTLYRGCAEEIFALLEFFEDKISCFICPQLTLLLSKYRDPIYLKIKKLQFLPLIISQHNCDIICDEVLSSCCNRNKNISKAAFNSVHYLLQRAPFCRISLQSELKSLKHMKQEHVIVNLFTLSYSLNDLNLHKIASEIFLPHHREYVNIHDQLQLDIYLSLLSKYVYKIPSASYIIEDLLNLHSGHVCGHILSSLLTCCVITFYTFPAQTHRVLVRILAICLLQNDADLKDQVKFYYNLLQSDSDSSKLIVGSYLEKTFGKEV